MEKNSIKIEYYHKNIYGRRLEFVKEPGQRQILTGLLRRTTISGVERELIRDLTMGVVQFVLVPQPEDDDEAQPSRTTRSP
jgi:hypothetical protein